MGFSHEATAHHFRLFKDGGEIAVSANTTTDTAAAEQIRQHLQHITYMFSSGNFNAPMLIHDATATGSVTMTRLRDEIRYDYSDTVAIADGVARTCTGVGYLMSLVRKL
jgi:hypothetical protein